MLAALMSGGAACSSSSQAPLGDGRVRVVASFTTLAEIAKQVGGSAVDVVSMVPPSAEAHEYELTVDQVAELHRANVVLFLGDKFQPQIDSARADLAPSVRQVDLLRGIALDHHDPHVWLDPNNMNAMVQATSTALIAAAPNATRAIRANAAAYRARLLELDRDMLQGLLNCSSRTFVTGHAAFGYLARRYSLTAVPIAGNDPEAQPSAKNLESIAAAARVASAHVIFTERNLPADLANSLARDLGIRTATLDTLETLSRDQIKRHLGYLELQRLNLVTLRAGLGCS